MTTLTVWTNHRMNAEQEARLLEATASHRLLLPQQATSATLAEADVAFGQPPVNEARDSERLRWVQLSSAGYGSYDKPDVRDAFARRGAALTKSSFVYANPCAEHVLSFMLAWARQLPSAFAEQHAARGWPQEALRQRSVLLTGQKVILFGFGSIGARLVQLSPPSPRSSPACAEAVSGREPIVTLAFGDERLGERLGEADHVINLLPGTPATAGYFDAKRFAQAQAGRRLLQRRSRHDRRSVGACSARSSPDD